MSVLADTNILLRRMQPAHPSHKLAVESVAGLLAAGEPVFYNLQTISEFWNVLTRPADKNGLGFSPEDALREVEQIERVLTPLPDTPAIYAEWKGLVAFYGVAGAKVHDAKLVAAMNVHGVRRILTFNAVDFARYDVEAIDPARVT